MKSPINFDHLDAIALENSCQISMEDGKRVYTCRTLTHCDRVCRAISSRTENDAVIVRKGVGSHYRPFHPNPLSAIWIEPNTKKGATDGSTKRDRAA